MNIGEQIRTYRKENGLTQEQIAQYLGVTAPAVNKWERGNTLPDITLLPALARLLKIDMNTLFSFHETLTDLEIAHFVNALYTRAMDGEVAAAFDDAQAKLRDYPHCVPLLYMCATMLNATLTLSTLSPEDKTRYTALIKSWYEQVAKSDNVLFRTAACYWLAMDEINSGHFDRAETLIAELPETNFDKATLSIHLLAAQEEWDAAALGVESQILSKTAALHTHLMQLIQFETETGHDDKAQGIADIASRLADLFHLWCYNCTTPQLVLALYRKDSEAALSHIRTILNALQQPWDGSSSPLFYRMAEAGNLPNIEAAFFIPFLREMESQPEYDFLRDNSDFQQLLAECRTKA